MSVSNGRRAVGIALLWAAVCGSVPAQARLRQAPRAFELNVFAPTQPLTEVAWLLDRVAKNRRFDLQGEPGLSLLDHYLEPGRNREPEWRSFWHGRYGRNDFQLFPKLSWAAGAAEPPSPELDWAPEPELLGLSQRVLCPRWKRPRPVSVVRYDGAEFARQPLVDCAGGIAPDALDRLSVLARPPATPRPELPLPLEPDREASSGEWLPRVKLLHPRLIWAVQKISEAFPGRSIFIMSGYRPGTHGSYHQQGRALDLYVTGVDNADLFRFCHTLSDVGCGFYPNNKFVHVDVRPFGSHRVAWVDISQPGAPSEYVSSWPGLFGAQELSTAGAAE